VLPLTIEAQEIKIVTKIDNEIITNIDIENEYLYLIALNSNLQDIEKNKIIELAKNSLIKEIIKKKELEKYYELNQKNKTIDSMIENIYKNIGLSSELDFKKYLENFNLDLNDVYKKIEVETVWNQMIYEIYKAKVVINEEKMRNEILNNEKTTELLLLYELVFDFKNKDEINKKYQEIINSINNVGFKETVIKYSISNSKLEAGSLGWVNKNALTQNIKNQIKDLGVGSISKPIIIPSGVLLLKIEDKRLETLKVDVDEELEKLTKYELNNQLNNYSTMHFNKIKNKLIINEY
tara:strand:- start:4 stop:885 length:882 start_codon:yes stop_codon:yes gene_type:complete